MRIAGALLALCCLLRAADADEPFPYRATIADPATLVRSGPGESYYPTSRLLHGAEVEVHRHDPNGWCAIRPPEGEFSLIAADCVQLLSGDDLAEVVGQETPVWTGSQVAKPDPHRWQIHLQPGERAVVLGVRSGPATDGQESQHWYKIAPPAGEFRWVPRAALAPAVKETSATASPAHAAEAVELPTRDEAPDGDETSPPEAIEAAVLPSPAGAVELVIPASYEAPLAEEPLAPTEATSPVVMDESPQPESVEPAFIQADREISPLPRASDAMQTEATSEEPAAFPASRPFEVEAASVQLDMTLAVAQDLNRWRLGPLRDRVEGLKANAASRGEREQVETLDQSLARFEQLYDRYRQFAAGEAPTASAPRAPAQERQPNRAPLSPPDGQDVASGVLTSLVPNGQTPPLALLDNEGRVAAYVTPAADANLTPFLGRHIRVQGTAEEVDASGPMHLMAAHAADAQVR